MELAIFHLLSASDPALDVEPSGGAGVSGGDLDSDLVFGGASGGKFADHLADFNGFWALFAFQGFKFTEFWF